MAPPAQGTVSISTTPEHLQPPTVVTQTVTPTHTTHVQTQSQVVPPPASPSPSVTSLTPGKLTGQNDSEPNAILIEQSPDADKVSSQSKDEECMYLKIKQADLNNPFIRQYLGYDKVIKTEPDVKSSITEVKTTSAPPVGASTVIKEEEQQTAVMQSVVQLAQPVQPMQTVPPILQPTAVYLPAGVPAGLQPMFPPQEPEPNYITIGDK